ncbi:MAG: HDIG domain-containing metalloprotein [Bacteroidales bacterium]
MAVSRRPPGIKTDKRYLYHLVFFVASIIIVVAISPREGKFRYEFQKGKPWLQTSLIAPWDFPILKPEDEISKERDSILKNFAPYFKLDPEVGKTMISQFDKYLNDLLGVYEAETKPLSPMGFITVKRDLNLILSNIYRKGIMEANDITTSPGEPYSEITVLKGKVGEEKPLSSFFLQKDAYQLVEVEKEKLGRQLGSVFGTPVTDFVSRVAFYNFIKPNLLYDAETSETFKDKLVREISLTRGLVQEGQLIIARGEIVNDSKYMILESLRSEYEKRLGMYDRWFVILGRLILVSSCYLALYLFMYHFRFDIISSTSKTFFIILVVLLFFLITRLVIYLPNTSIFLIPFAIIPIVVRTFYDSRLALFVYLIAIMLAGFIVPNSFEFAFISYIAGVIVIFSLTNIYKRAKLFTTAFLVFLTYSVVYFGIGVMQEGSIENMHWKNYLWFAGNGVLLMLSYPLIFVFEKTFNFLSDATLFELSDTNQPLLRRLADKAPGSFQHSLQVANLAEEAAREISANTLLARTGALYHDIGKAADPSYFIENQSEGFSPHDQLEPIKSSKIIIDHVKEGMELAKKYKLPAPIIDFILTHHGTSVAFYFYKKYLDRNPRATDMEKSFSYLGPKPFSKETAIVMMADAVEAASRTLQNYSEENISELVERIVYIQEQDGQFSETPLTFKDITDIKRVFIKRLSNIYHARIAYPERGPARS